MNMKYFEYEHLPENLQKISAPLGDLARRMQVELPEGEEKAAGLRKLLEAKDCFVRAAMNTAPVVGTIDTLAYMILSDTVETLRAGNGRDSIRCIIALKSNPLIKITFAYQFKRGIEIKTEVEAVLLVDKDAECIQGIADMLPEVPHFFTDEGIVFTKQAHDDTEAETVTYGMYIIKEKHGISAMTKELFENISELVTDEDEETHS